ncbi:MAG: glycosyltransferase [Pseudodesulfovibrio sp.]|nr:glycosyltransferase [Pseudodesulfovibrio sp.]
MRITVYITNYNYSAYVEKAIQSVLEQTFGDFELLIIDDGSTDNSRDLISQYSEHEKVKCVFQSNKGLNRTNNIALNMARGEFIMRLDADDVLDVNALTIMNDYLLRHPEVHLVFPDYFVTDGQGEVMDVVRRNDFDDLTILDHPAHGACTLVNRECLLDIGGYDEDFTCQDGWDFWIKFIRKYEVANINLPLFYYRQHGSNLTTNENRLIDTRQKILSKHSNNGKRQLQTTAIIPVRGPSVDPGSVAFEKVGGKYLIDWTVDAARKASRLDQIVVTTPCHVVVEHVQEKYPDVCVLLRDKALGYFNVNLEATISHVIEKTEISGETSLMLLYIESPFRTAKSIDAAVATMEVFEADVVVSVRPENSIIFRPTNTGLEPVRESYSLRLERDSLFRSSGQILLVDKTFFAETKSIIGGRVGHVLISKQESMRIRGDWDLALANAIVGNGLIDDTKE